jgi:ribosomal protein L11 methyltransferase
MLLVGWGVPLAELIEEDIDGRKTISFYCRSRKQAQAFASKLSRIKKRGIRVEMDVLYQDDWLTRWKKDWKPFALTRTIDVVPVWCKTDYQFSKRKYILLDTVSSFGTGLHETTQFMARLIEMLRGKFNSCLDIGTGTGILALVALKNGAKEVHALDVDDMCVKAASANFKANDYSNRSIILQDISRLKTKHTYDLVCANLVTHDLVRMKDKIIACVKPGGWLAVSGISLENLPLLRRGFQDLPLRCVKISKGKKWTAVLFKRKT